MESLESQNRAIGSEQTRYSPNLSLKRARELKGWAQADVAKKIGAQPNLVTRWERGYASPSPYYRQKLCELFDQTTEELGFLKGMVTDIKPESLPDEVPPESENSSVSEQILLPLIQPADKKSFSRRRVLIGLAASSIIGGVAGLTWWQTYAHRAITSPVGASSPLVYTYQTHPPTGVNDVKWSPKGTFLACANGDKTVQILNAVLGQVTMTYRGHTGFINCASWSPDETQIASASADTTVQIWNPVSGAQITTYTGHKTAVWCVAWSPDGTRMASGGSDSTIHIWDIPNGYLITTYRGHTKGIWMVSWSPDSQSVASCGEDGTIQVWEAATGRRSDTFLYQGNPNSTVYEVAWSPDGKRIASASADATVQIWDALTGSRLLVCPGHTASVQTVKWSFDGKLLASGSQDKTVRLWDAMKGEQTFVYTSHRDVVYGVSWSPDGKMLASGSADTTMQVYRAMRLSR